MTVNGWPGHPLTQSAPGGALDLITSQAFAGSSSVSVNGCFSSTYDNYLILSRLTGSTNLEVYMRFRAGGTDLSTAAAYFSQGFFYNAAAGYNLGSNTYFSIGNYSSYPSAFDINVYGPASGVQISTRSLASSGKTTSYVLAPAVHASATQAAYTADGFTIYPSTGTITGALRVYGYRN